MTNNPIQTAQQSLKKMVFPKGSVGKKITAKVPTVSSDLTIGEIKAQLPEFAQKTDTIDYIYILNKDDQLVGVISVKEITQHDENKQVKEVMVKDLVFSHPQVKKERVAHLAIKHNIKAVPIVDDKNRLLGVLQSDDLLKILYDEHKQAMNRNAGIISLPESFGTILDNGIWSSFISRLPWIIVGLIGGVFAAQIIELFEGTLSENIVLAAFIPLIVYISDAVGTQTQTFFVRDIAFNPKLDIIPYTVKQFVTTALIGVICGGLVWGLVALFWSSSFLGVIIGLVTFTAIASSTLIAIFVPYVLFRLRQDPASGSGPFATILQDLFSIYVYFLIASLLL